MIAETPRGLFCEGGGFYIDPWQPVDRALITHAHADHASAGSRAYLCATPGAQILRRRLPDATIASIDYGVPVTIGNVRVSFHPAGHILGSAQIRLERGGEVWVVSGDYKRAPDATCAPFEPLRCDVFVTEATFALPIYTWDPPSIVVREIVDWWHAARQEGRSCVLFCYVLGKAQRVLALLQPFADVPIRIHGALAGLTDAYRESGIALAATERITEDMRGPTLAGSLVLAPLSARGTVWMRRLPRPSTAFASGLMRVRGVRRQRGFDRGFVLSDHADWPGLLATIRETGAPRVFVTHGWSDALARYLAEAGLETQVMRTAFEGEAGEFGAAAAASADEAGERS
ncbi:MAG TPA: ligase-associated DNA damage response exonuclease [Vicinamibacterales bacterium]|jgi:putative mRNA 3-end processing factor|nr:ligase-associated DNA damage response exonuclease [Vicinamibacterales bacterium]